MTDDEKPKVVLLKKPDPPTNKSAIVILEECLAEAKSGRVTECFVVMDGPEQSYWLNSELRNLDTMVGLIERSKVEFLRDCEGT